MIEEATAAAAGCGVEGEHGQQPVDGRLRPGVGVDPAVDLDAVERGPRGGVVGRPAAGVRAEEPAGRQAAQGQEAGRRGQVGGREQPGDASLGAVGDLRLARNRGPRVVGSTGGQHLRRERPGVGQPRRAQRRPAEHLSRPAQGLRCLTTPRVPEALRQGPGQDRPERPDGRLARPHRRDAFGQPAERRAGALVVGLGPNVCGQPQARLGRGVGTPGDEPRRDPHVVGNEPLPVGAEASAVEGVQSQVQPVTKERRHRGVDGAERGIPLTDRPQRPGQPVGLGGVRGVGRVRGLRREVEGAVGLHPERDVAGVRPGRVLEVGQRAQQTPGIGQRSGGALCRGAHEDDGRASDVVGVVRALRPVAGCRVEGPTADPRPPAAGVGVGVGPRSQTDRVCSDVDRRVEGAGGQRGRRRAASAGAQGSSAAPAPGRSWSRPMPVRRRRRHRRRGRFRPGRRWR